MESKILFFFGQTLPLEHWMSAAKVDVSEWIYVLWSILTVMCHFPFSSQLSKDIEEKMSKHSTWGMNAFARYCIIKLERQKGVTGWSTQIPFQLKRKQNFCPDYCYFFSKRWVLQSTPLHEGRPILPQARGLSAWPVSSSAATGSLDPQPDAAGVPHPGPSQDSRPGQAAGPDAGSLRPGQPGRELQHLHLAPEDSHHAQLQQRSDGLHVQHEQQPHQQQQGGRLQRLAAREQLLGPGEAAEAERGGLLQVLHAGVVRSAAQTRTAAPLRSQHHSGSHKSGPQQACGHLSESQAHGEPPGFLSTFPSRGRRSWRRPTRLDRDPANPTVHVQMELNIRELLTPTNSSSRLVLSSTQFLQETHSQMQNVISVVIFANIDCNQRAEGSEFMKTIIASMKLCDHLVLSHTHARAHTHTHPRKHNVLHSFWFDLFYIFWSVCWTSAKSPVFPRSLSLSWCLSLIRIGRFPFFNCDSKRQRFRFTSTNQYSPLISLQLNGVSTLQSSHYNPGEAAVISHLTNREYLVL